jgi:hypothetical protein
MAQEINTTKARQGEGRQGARIFWVGAISTGLAVLLAVVAYFWLLATPAEEARGNIPQVESPNTDSTPMPPAGAADGG